jgi:hypothetical protein
MEACSCQALDPSTPRVTLSNFATTKAIRRLVPSSASHRIMTRIVVAGRDRYRQDSSPEVGASSSFLIYSGSCSDSVVRCPAFEMCWPWGRRLLDRSKSVETRGYAVPEKYRGVRLDILETQTPGASEGIIIGSVVFIDQIVYASREQWARDAWRHHVDATSAYGWPLDAEDLRKFGWVASCIRADVPLTTSSRMCCDAARDFDDASEGHLARTFYGNLSTMPMSWRPRRGLESHIIHFAWSARNPYT